MGRRSSTASGEIDSAQEGGGIAFAELPDDRAESGGVRGEGGIALDVEGGAPADLVVAPVAIARAHVEGSGARPERGMALVGSGRARAQDFVTAGANPAHASEVTTAPRT